jgi:hypothetical protein
MYRNINVRTIEISKDSSFFICGRAIVEAHTIGQTHHPVGEGDGEIVLIRWNTQKQKAVLRDHPEKQ